MYKYTEKLVLDLLFYENRIRIGTLNWYKYMEEKTGISDPLEGSYCDILHIPYFDEKDYYKNPNLRANLNHNLLGPNCHNIQFIDTKFIKKRTSPNLLVFCFSRTKSEKLLSEFEGAECCYEIHNPKSFFQLITWNLIKEFKCSVNFLGIHKIDYDEYERIRTDMNSSPIHPAQTKENKYSPQGELRAIWEVPPELIDKHFYDLQIPGLRKSCRVVNF